MSSPKKKAAKSSPLSSALNNVAVDLDEGALPAAESAPAHRGHKARAADHAGEKRLAWKEAEGDLQKLKRSRKADPSALQDAEASVKEAKRAFDNAQRDSVVAAHLDRAETLLKLKPAQLARGERRELFDLWAILRSNPDADEHCVDVAKRIGLLVAQRLL